MQSSRGQVTCIPQMTERCEEDLPGQVKSGGPQQPEISQKPENRDSWEPRRGLTCDTRLVKKIEVSNEISLMQTNQSLGRIVPSSPGTMQVLGPA